MKLNIGGQKGRKTLNKQGAGKWTVLDVRKGADIIHDVHQEPLPLEDNSVEAIYTSHTLEHIFPDRLPFVLKECLRVLKPEGLIRIVVPDADRAVRAYAKGDIDYLKDKRNPTKPDFYPNHPLYYLMAWFITYSLDDDLNKRLIGGHVNAFNESALKGWLSRAGFVNIKVMAYNKCNSIFNNCDFPRYKDCSIYMEAQKGVR